MPATGVLSSLAFMPGMGELIIILLIVLLVFGAGKLPSIGDSLGRSIRNFKRAMDTDDGAIEVSRKKAKQPKAMNKTVPAKELDEPDDADDAEAAEAAATDDDGDGDDEEEVVVVRKRKTTAAKKQA